MNRDIRKLAHAISGHIIEYKHVNIWDTNDYVHVVVKRNPQFVKKNEQTSEALVALERQTVRAHRVASRLKEREAWRLLVRLLLRPHGLRAVRRVKAAVAQRFQALGRDS